MAYNLLVGRITGGDREDDDPESPHYKIYVLTEISSGGTVKKTKFEVPVNVLSKEGSYVRYKIDEGLKDHPFVRNMLERPHGKHQLKREEDRLDYLRSGLKATEGMSALPPVGEAHDDDLQDGLDRWVRDAIGKDATIYAFGSSFPGGIHNIHMNQGNPRNGPHRNSTFGDGGLFFDFGDKVVGFFYAFQSQKVPTDDRGDPVAGAKPIPIEE